MTSSPLTVDRCMATFGTQTQARNAKALVPPTSRLRKISLASTKSRFHHKEPRRLVLAWASPSLYSVQPRSCTPALECLVQESVKRLDMAPCLHLLVEDSTIETHSVPQAVAAAPELWRGITEHLTSRNPNVMVLVHRIPEGEENPGCLHPAAGKSSSASPGMACSNRLLSAGLAQQIMAGNVGECCEDDDHHGVPHSQGYINLALRQSGLYENNDDGIYKDIAFWGLVIQSVGFPDMEGCYLLKTMRVVDGTGCMCTHFSLTKVCSGVPLCDQYSAAWLV